MDVADIIKQIKQLPWALTQKRFYGSSQGIALQQILAIIIALCITGSSFVLGLLLMRIYTIRRFY